MPAEVVLLLRVMLRVEESLANHRDDAHKRFWIRILFAALGIERNVLEGVRLNDGLVGIHAGQRDQGARAADNSFFRNHVARRKAQSAGCLQSLFVGGETSGDALLRQDLCHLIAGTGLAALALAAGHAEEMYSARGIGGIKFDFPAVNRAVGGVEPQIGVDETGINRRSFHLPNARIGRRCQVAANRLDEPVANDDGCAVHGLARLDDELAADQRVYAGRNGPMTGRKNVSGESRQ